VLRLIPGDLARFEEAALWKRLRFEFAPQLLWSGTVAGVAVRVTGGRTAPPG